MTQPDRQAPRCPLCGRQEALAAHEATLNVADREVQHRVLVCGFCGLAFAHSEPDYDWSALYGSVWREPPPSTASF